MPCSHSLARMRLEECLASHEVCHQNDIPALPDRVIDVGKTRWRLIDSRGMRAKYIALSHCWGGQIELKLERKTNDAFRGGLAISKLAKNFQDAMKIAQNLGIRYLWIDCLCIIQDSTSDWLEQSKKMASLYSHATLTIYAMASETSHNGILTPRNSSMIKEMSFAQPVCVPVYKAGRVTDSEAQLELVHAEEDWEEDSQNLARNSILASRGWALQEYVLAPRRLIFGTRTVYWECLRGTQTMDGFTLTGGMYWWPKFNEFTSWARMHAHFPRSKSRGQELLKTYYELVEFYGARQLTKSSDKLPAFSAIAGSVHPAIGGDYIAGLWTADLHHGLVWFYERWSRHQPLPASYRAPSWSWAKSDHEVGFYDSTHYPFDGTALPLHESWKLSLVDSTNPYGEIQWAQLNLTVWTKRLQFVPSGPIPSQGNPQDGDLWFPDFDVFDESTENARKAITILKESEIYTMFVTGTENWVPWDYLLIAVMEGATVYSNRSELLCLVIGRASNATSEAYERMGLLKTSASRDWQQSWPRQSITLC